MLQLQLTFPAHLLVAFTERPVFLFFGEVYYAVGRTSKGSAGLSCKVSHKGHTGTLEQSRFFSNVKDRKYFKSFLFPFCWMCCSVHPAHVWRELPVPFRTGTLHGASSQDGTCSSILGLAAAARVGMSRTAIGSRLT